MRRLVLAVLGASLLAAPAHALDPGKPLGRCSMARWQVKDGLPGDAVRSIVQGLDNQLWIATLGGLARYDGVHFTRVEVAADWISAASDLAALLAAPDGSVWGGSARHPPMRFRQGAAQMLGTSEGLATGEGTLAFAEDARGQLWMTSAHALYRFSDGRFTAHALRGLEDRHPEALLVDHAGTVWLGSERGLFSVAGEALVPAPQLPRTANVLALYEDRRHALWVAADQGLWTIEGERVTRRAPGVEGPFAAIAGDDDGNVWVGGAAGLLRLREGKADLFTTRDGLPENDVTAVLSDREGSLWVGTRNGGVAQFTDRTLDTHDLPPELEGLDVHSVAEAADGAVWFGTRGHGAIRWQRGPGAPTATVYTVRDGLPGDSATSVLPGSENEVWIGTPKGLARWRAGKIDDPGLWPRQVTSLFRDRRGVVWIGGLSELGRLEGGHLERYGAEHNVPKQVRVMTDGPDGALWAGGMGGFGRWENGRFARPASLRDLKLGPVRSFITDGKGAVWLSAERVGLVRVKGPDVTVFGPARGLLAEMVYQMQFDDAGDLWIGTNKSILRVTGSSLDAVAEGRRPTLDVISFETTDRRAGVVASQLKQPAVWKGHDGRLWFVTRQGAVTIDPRRVRTNPLPPVMAIEQVLADGKVMPLGIGERHFGAGLRALEIHYIARTLLEPSKVRYRYRLDGFGADWIEAGDRRVAAFTGLAAGAYHFKVQGANADGVWNERGANFSFTIGAPFYRRYWFYLACALGLAPIGLLLHRARVARLRAQYVVMFAERSRVARELHDTLLQGMSAVAIQLNGIRMRLTEGPEGPRRDLELVQDTVTRCLEETRRVMWDLRDRGGGGGDLGAALQRFARRISQGSGVACGFAIEGAPGHLPHAVEDQLFRIGQEALTNAVKHAQANKIEGRLHYEGMNVTLTVSDDGRGFDPAVPPGDGHFGLVGMRERAEAIGARFQLQSTVGGGTTITVVVAR
jgi:ligand-binding sensor domain-containing protein